MATANITTDSGPGQGSNQRYLSENSIYAFKFTVRSSELLSIFLFHWGPNLIKRIETVQKLTSALQQQD